MFKTKGAMFGLAVALVAGSLLVAGMAVTTTQGAPTDGNGTDFQGGINGGPSAFDGLANPPTGNPPAGPVEPPTNPTDPTINPGANGGNTGAGGAGPAGLPDAGFGTTSDDGSSTMVLLLGLAGALLAGAGATAVSANRRK